MTIVLLPNWIIQDLTTLLESTPKALGVGPAASPRRGCPVADRTAVLQPARTNSSLEIIRRL